MTSGGARVAFREDRRAFLQAVVPAAAVLLSGCQKAGEPAAQGAGERPPPCGENERRDPDIDVVRKFVLPLGLGPAAAFRAARDDEP